MRISGPIVFGGGAGAGIDRAGYVRSWLYRVAENGGFSEEYVHVEEAIFSKESRELLGISSSTVSNTLVKANSSVKEFLFNAKDSLILLAVGVLIRLL